MGDLLGGWPVWDTCLQDFQREGKLPAWRTRSSCRVGLLRYCDAAWMTSHRILGRAMSTQQAMPCSRRGLLLGTLALAACRSTPPLPELGSVPTFSLESQDAAPFGSRQLEGRVWAVAFMFTRCPTVCPRVTRFMRKLQVAAKSDNVAVRLLSISVDPENDTPPVLKEYARRFDADLSSWTFLTGDFEAIKKTSEEGFKLALEGRADASAKDFGIVHGSHLVLVDQRSKIRGYYRTDDEQEAERLLVDAKRLAS